MKRKLLFYSLFSVLLALLSDFAGHSAIPEVNINDSVDVQVLYNGRAWRNIYYRIRGDQFLFSTEFLTGSVTIDGKTFGNLPLRYDIYNDELLTITDNRIILQLNKEMLDLFTMVYKDHIFRFKRLEADSLNALSGFVNILYEGGTSLYVKYRKEILLQAVDNKYDMFNQVNRIFIEKNGRIFRVDTKKKLLKVLEDQKRMVRSFIRSSKLMITRRNPDSFTPVIEYYDKLQH